MATSDDTSILEETERSSGRAALRKNVQAAMALAGAVRSTLGPKGLDKLREEIECLNAASFNSNTTSDMVWP